MKCSDWCLRKGASGAESETVEGQDYGLKKLY
jgi:hypothetical protein